MTQEKFFYIDDDDRFVIKITPFDNNEENLSEVEMIEVRPLCSIKHIANILNGIGMANFNHRILNPSCLILKKQNRFFITHFKEMFALEGRTTNINYDDIDRKEFIAHYLEEIGLLEIISGIEEDVSFEHCNFSDFGLNRISGKNNPDWLIVPKYSLNPKRMALHAF